MKPIFRFPLLCCFLFSAISLLAQPMTLSTQVFPPNCFNPFGGTISVQVSGGIPSYSYNWTGPGGFTSTGQYLSTVQPGTYCVTVTDAQGSTATTCATMVPLFANITLSFVACPTSCGGSNNGSVSVTASGGVGPYTYLWSTGSTTPGLTNLPPGTYSPTVTDSQGCTASGSAVVAAGTSTLNVQGFVTSMNPNQPTGSIDLFVTGGSAPYSYSWAGPGMTSFGNPMYTNQPGQYSVTVTDNNGCTATETFSMYFDQNGTTNPLTVGGLVTNSSCSGPCSGSISLLTSGGVDPFYFQWFANGSDTLPPNATLTGLCPGTYTVYVNSSDGQFTEAAFTVTQGSGDLIDIQSSNAAFCNYSDDNTANVCEKVCPHSTVTYSITPPTNCGTLVSLLNKTWEVLGAESYSISQNQQEVVVNWGEAGNGQVSFSASTTQTCYENNRCVTVVEEPEANFLTDPLAPAGGPLQVCKGQTVFFNNKSLHADNYEWQFSDDLSVVTTEHTQHTYHSPGLYSVLLIARSECLCADSLALVVDVLDTQPPLLDCVGSVCPNEVVTYSTSSNCASYTWTVSPNGTVQGGGTAGDNSITIQWTGGAAGTISLAAFNCGGSTCPQASVFSVPIISDDAEIRGAEAVCSGSEEEYTIDPFDGTEFQWKVGSGGNIVRGQGTNKIVVAWTANASGNLVHWVSVKYNNCYLGCGGEDSLAVKILSPFVINGPVEICYAATVNFNTLYTQYTGSLNCNWTITGPDGTVVWNSPSPASSISFTPMNGTGEYHFLATPYSPVITCSASAEWVLKVAALPYPPSAIVGPPLICPGEPYTYSLTGNDPFNIEWTIQNGAAAAASQTGRTVNVGWGNAAPRWLSAAYVSLDGLGCKSDTVRFQVQALGQMEVSGDPSVCANALGTYAASPALNLDYQWEILPADAGVIKSGQGKPNLEVFWETAGSHTLRLTACGFIADFPVTVLGNPQPKPFTPQGVCPGDTAIAMVGGSFSSFLWKKENGATMSTGHTAPVVAGNYTLEVTDANGCAGTTEFTVASYPKPNVTATTADPTYFCNHEYTVLITALTLDDGDFDYQWFLDGSPFGGNTPTISTSLYGAYSVVVTNERGCTAEDGAVHLVEYCAPDGVCHNPNSGPHCQPGDAFFTIEPTARCDSFAFQIASPSGLVQSGSAFWRFFESGSDLLGTANGDNPHFQFPNGGKYIVDVKVLLTNGALCALLDSVDVEAVAQFSHKQACPGDSTQFTDQSTRLPEVNIASWAWEFGLAGNADVSNLASPGYPYAAAGNYMATLTVTAASGCTSSYSAPVFVPEVPAPTFAPPAANCVDNATEFKVLPATNNFTDISWDFGEPASGALNSSDAATAYHSFSATGNHGVTLNVTNLYGCKAGFSQTVNIQPNPFSGEITPGGITTFCEGKSVLLNAPAGFSAAYKWSNGATTAGLTVTEEGVYDVTLTDPNGCTYSPQEKAVEMNPSPDGIIKALLMNEIGQVVGTSYPSLSTCAGEDVHLVVQDNGAYNYKWSGNNGQNDNIAFTEEHNNLLSVGTHLYTVTITNPGTGCTAVAADFTVTVNPLPSGFALSADKVCAGTPSTITYLGGLPANWELYWNTGETNQTSLVTEAEGLYFVRVVNEFGCTAQSNTVVIFPGPNIAALPKGCHARCNPDTLCLPLLPDIVSWQWYFEGAAIPGATTNQFVATQSGTYYAALSDVNGCAAQSAPLTLELEDGYGDILGQVWSDVNNNGLVDAGDTLVQGIAVQLWKSGTMLNAGQSGADGGFAFADMLSTGYSVQVDQAQLPLLWEIVIGQADVMLHGCSAIGLCDLLLKPYQCPPLSSALSLQACPGSTVHYAGTDLPVGATQNFTFQTALGCDSTVTISVTAFPASGSALTLSACPGTAATYAGANIPIGATQNFTFQNWLGCDSTVAVTVTALPASTQSLTLSTCPGTMVNYAGTNLPVGATQDFTFPNWLGCDSTVTVTVTALPTSTKALTLSGCPGTTVGYGGASIPVGATQSFVFQNWLGCDSTVTVSVTAFPTSSEALEVNVCPGTTYVFSGGEVPAGQTQTFHFLTTEGCDSSITVTATAWPGLDFSVQSEQACPDSATGTLAVQVAAGASLPLEFSLNKVDFQADALFDALVPGDYEVTVRDGHGCIFDQSAAVPLFPPLEVALPGAYVIPCDSASITLAPEISGDTLGLSMLWWNGLRTPAVSTDQAGPVWLEASNHCGTERREAIVSWADIDGNIEFVYLPNAVAPEASLNGNDMFRPFFAPGLDLVDFKLEVYDRWGELLWVTSQPEHGWSGPFRRNDVQPGVFVWLLKAHIRFCGRILEINKKGDVTVVR